MKTGTYADGFTLIELMLGIIASSILMLAVGLMLIYGWLGWRRNVESVSMHRDAMVAMHVIEHRIRNAALGDIGWDVSQITFLADQGFSSTEITPGYGVVLEPSSFNVESNAYGGIVVSFNLATASATDNERYEMTIYPRN